MSELIWDGKYENNSFTMKDGRIVGKRAAPLRIQLPFQTVETVNESAQDRDRMKDLFDEGEETDWRNRLIWGDKKYVLPSLLAEFAGKVNLIYIDPPFDTGANFSFTTTIPETVESFTKEPSVIEQKAYRDTWGKGLDSYLKWFYETAVLLRELLADDGSFYVHLDHHVGHYAKVILDEVFGIDQYQNELIWKRTSARSDSHTHNHIHDVIFLFTKSQNYIYNVQYNPYDESYIDNFYRHIDPETGRKYRLGDLTAAGVRRGDTGNTWRGINPTAKGRHWMCTLIDLEKLDAEGRIYWPAKEGGVPAYKRFLDEMQGVPLQSLWTDITPIAAQATENVNYSTQKPEALLERIIKASSNEGDLVLDCFCGSGTTAATAEKLGRRWITCDLGRFAVHTARKRLLAVPNVKPFVVQNLGKYERQEWQKAEFGENAPAIQLAYRNFILDLYKARPLSGGYQWLHGVKNGRYVHIGSVDAPIASKEVQQIAIEFRQSIGTGSEAPETNGVDVLGWDFAFEINEMIRQQMAQSNIKMRFVKIPHEVLEKKAVEQGDIKFFELAALAAEVEVGGKSVTIRLSDFIMDLDFVPADVQQAVTHWEQWIDYWAVDWDYQNDAFHNMDQKYRTRKATGLQMQMAHTYAEPGTYNVLVKVIDILGNDTTRKFQVTIE